MTERNGSISADKRIEFRIGVNLGDVIVEEHDIFGDGVNVAGQSRRFDGARRCTGVGQTRAQAYPGLSQGRGDGGRLGQSGG